jgi:hypothetical protein
MFLREKISVKSQGPSTLNLRPSQRPVETLVRASLTSLSGFCCCPVSEAEFCGNQSKSRSKTSSKRILFFFNSLPAATPPSHRDQHTG